MNAASPYYQRTYRRLLLDMHVPDWDPGFLARFDPQRILAAYEKAHVDAVLLYCQSHLGLCYWPTRTGKMHANLHGRDIVGETLDALKMREIPAAAYYSVTLNHWAFKSHPEWRVVLHAAFPSSAYYGSRMPMCCANHPEYRAFAKAQAQEIVSRYDFDGFFFDIVFFIGVCLCSHCRRRYRDEQGAEIPRTVNWLDPQWVRFQAARERWLTEFAQELAQAVKSVRPGMPVYHNCACMYYKWLWADSTSSAVHHDFLGADFYGDATEQLIVMKLMNNLTENRPPEFMTSRCTDLSDHVRLKSFDMMRMQALAATWHSSAFMFIDAVDPSGAVNEAVYERIGRIYDEKAAYEPYLGGEPVEDIAVYFSTDSKMSFGENGLALAERGDYFNSYPHRDALRGVCRALQQAHVPFGVITRRQLPDLGRYKLVVLPNVLRMDDREVEAFREYVRGGGRLYASGYTSLVHTDGYQCDDFMLADVFGCSFEADRPGIVRYLKPQSEWGAQLFAPQDYLGVVPRASGDPAQPPVASGIILRPDSRAKVLATQTLPYDSPGRGSAFEENYASFHSSPPWRDTPNPMLVHHRFGDGETIYSAADLESEDAEANQRVLLGLLLSLVDDPFSYRAETHPAVWMQVTRQPDKRRMLIGFLNYQAQLPAIPIPRVRFTLQSPQGASYLRLLHLPDLVPVDFTLGEDGSLHAEIQDLEALQMLVAEYEHVY